MRTRDLVVKVSLHDRAGLARNCSQMFASSRNQAYRTSHRSSHAVARCRPELAESSRRRRLVGGRLVLTSTGRRTGEEAGNFCMDSPKGRGSFRRSCPRMLSFVKSSGCTILTSSMISTSLFVQLSLTASLAEILL